MYLFQTYIINKEVEGRKYIHYASDYGQLDVLKYLIANGAHKDVSWLPENFFGLFVLLKKTWEKTATEPENGYSWSGYNNTNNNFCQIGFASCLGVLIPLETISKTPTQIFFSNKVYIPCVGIVEIILILLYFSGWRPVWYTSNPSCNLGR